MTIQTLFNDADRVRIREAVAQAERRSGGEIVPYLVDRLSGYQVAHWRLASLCALLAGLLAGAFLPEAGREPTLAIVWGMTMPALGIGGGYLLAWVPVIRRLLLSDADINPLVKCRCEGAFLEEAVFRTQERTGILIFLAVFERRAVILADEGINRVVPAGLWQELVDELVDGIRAGRAAESLCSTIERCAAILQEHGIESPPDDRNELADGLRVRTD